MGKRPGGLAGSRAMVRPRYLGHQRHIRGSRFHGRVANTASPHPWSRRALANRPGWNRTKARDFARSLLWFAAKQRDMQLLLHVLESFFPLSP